MPNLVLYDLTLEYLYEEKQECADKAETGAESCPEEAPTQEVEGSGTGPNPGSHLSHVAQSVRGIERRSATVGDRGNRQEQRGKIPGSAVRTESNTTAAPSPPRALAHVVLWPQRRNRRDRRPHEARQRLRDVSVPRRDPAGTVASNPSRGAVWQAVRAASANASLGSGEDAVRRPQLPSDRPRRRATSGRRNGRRTCATTHAKRHAGRPKLGLSLPDQAYRTRTLLSVRRAAAGSPRVFCLGRLRCL